MVDWQPVTERQIRKLYERYMEIPDMEMGFDVGRALETIGRDGLGVTMSMDAFDFMKDQIAMFIGTRLMRRWNQTALAPQRVIVTVRVDVE